MGDLSPPPPRGIPRGLFDYKSLYSVHGLGCARFFGIPDDVDSFFQVGVRSRIFPTILPVLPVPRGTKLDFLFVLHRELKISSP